MAIITGTAKKNTLTGTTGDDTISGLANDDTLLGNLGNNTLDGGDGTDTASYTWATGGVTVNLALTTPQTVMLGATDKLVSIENLTGSNYDDVLIGDAGNNVLKGGTGNDVLKGGLGNDTLNGGGGVDTVDYSDMTGSMNINLSTGSATGASKVDTISGVENVVGGNFGDTITGSSAANVLTGGAGNDTISGGGGADTLNGGDGDDTLNGDAGIDILNGGAGNDVLRGGAGSDTMTGGAGNDRFILDVAAGAAQADTITDLASGDRVELASVAGLKVNGVLLSSATSDVTVGATFDANNNVRFVNGHLQVDLNNSRTFTAAGDFDAGLTGVNALHWSAADRAFEIGPAGPPPLLPTLAIAAVDASHAEGQGNLPSSFTFAVDRSGDTSGASDVHWSVTGSGANPADAADFVGNALPSGTVSFAAGENHKVVTVSVVGDTVVESNEGFTVTLDTPHNATIATAAANGTILNDDVVPPPALAITAADAAHPEGNVGDVTAFTFTVARSGDVSGASSVHYAVTGTEVDAADFVGNVLPSGTVDFAANETSKTVTVNVAGDTAVETDEHFTVALDTPVNATITTATAEGIVQNDDVAVPPTLAIAATNAVKPEGNVGGVTAFTFTVTRTGDLSQASSVVYAVTSTSADATDFLNSVMPSGTVNFAVGQPSQTVTIYVTGDTVVEANEVFTVSLSAPVNATIGTASVDGTILNDDVAPPPPALGITATNIIKAEGSDGSVTPFTFTVTRTGDISQASTAHWAVTGVDDTDVNSNLSGTVSFAANDTASQTITVNVIADTVYESDEAFTVTLSSPTNATIAVASATSTIANDDVAPPPIVGTDGNDNLVGTIGNDLMQGLGGVDILTSGSGDDILDGGAGYDVLDAGLGNDELHGGNSSDNDELYGGAGNDVLYGGAGSDILNGGDGNDTASYTDAAIGVVVTLAKATAQDTVGSDSDILTSIENLVGSNQGDMLTGNAGNNVLHGGEGDDKLYGGAGDDSLYGDRGNDTMYGDAGNDTFYSDVVAGQADTIVVAEVGDHLRLLNLSPDVSVTVAGTTVGTAFDASNNVRFVDHQLQVDVDGNKAFDATKDFAVNLSGVGSVTWDATTQQFGFGALPTAPTPNKVFALTFDDGPWTTASSWKPMDSTQYIFDILQRYGAKATFFEVGDVIAEAGAQGAALMRTMSDAGMLLENHTWDHKALPGYEGLNPPLTPAEVTKELQDTTNAIVAATGVTPVYYRPPYGLHNNAIDAIAASINNSGMQPVTWTADTVDWDAAGGTTVASIVHDALAQATDGGVILMHDGGGDRSMTMAALPLIIEGLQAQGYQLVTMNGIANIPVDYNADDVLPSYDGKYVFNAHYTGPSISGDAGANALEGTPGNDVMLGFAGNDTFHGGGGNDTFQGGDGVDTVSYADNTSAIDVNLTRAVFQDVGSGGKDMLYSIEGLTGTAFADKLTGNASDNVLHGGAGDDRLLGSAGNDVLDGGAGNDLLHGGAGSDVFVFSSMAAGEKDTVIADTNDVLDFGAFANSLKLSDSTHSGVLSALTANVAVGATFDVNNDIRFVIDQVGNKPTGVTHLQVDLNHDHNFVAGQDFEIALNHVAGVTWNAATDKFDITMTDTAKVFALSFDGPSSLYLPQIKSVLDAFSVKASFFDVGSEIHLDQNAEILKSLNDEGHVVGNHSYSHPSFLDLVPGDEALAIDELTHTNAELTAAGIPQPQYFRPPFGDTSDEVNALVKTQGLQTVLWTVDTLDWNNKDDPSAPGNIPPGAPGYNGGVFATEQSIANAVLTGATDGGVSLMHDLAGDVSATVAALDDIIIGLQTQGYEFVNMHGIPNLPVTWNDNGQIVLEANQHYVQPHYELTV